MSRTRKALIILVVILLIPVFVYFCFPGVMLCIGQSIERGRAHLEKKSIMIDDYRIVYLEGGTGETVLLLHGFGADKDNWTKFAAYLTPGYHVVIPDIPGFGESTKDDGASYDIESQVSRIKKFTDALGLKKFHIAGNSMGGVIAGVFAENHGDMITSLALVNSAGVKSKIKSDFQKMLESGENPLLINKASDFDNLMDMLFVEKPRIPGPVKKYLAARSMKDRAFNEKIMKGSRGLQSTLEQNLGKLEMPVLILWGDRDRLIHVSCTEVFAKGIKNSTVTVLKDCGHIPQMEKSAEAADVYLMFLKK